MKCVTLVLALMLPQMAMARIGETYEGCVSRYGVDGNASLHGSKDFGQHQARFTKGGLIISAKFFP